MSDIRKNLHTYMTNYSNGGFLGCLKDIQYLLSNFGKEWSEYGREDWGRELIVSAEHMEKIIFRLQKLNEEFEIEMKVFNE